MPPSPPSDHALEHSRRGQIRKYLQRFTTTIRRGSKDPIIDDSIPQSNADDTLFDFTNIIAADEPPTTEDAPANLPCTTETFHIDRASVYQDRAQKLRDRYGVDMAGGDRSTFPPTARRVQKPARMRLHRHCHLCGVDFGHGVNCRACHHRVCGECPRSPGRGIKEAMAQAREFPFHVVSVEDSRMEEASTDVSDQYNELDLEPSSEEYTTRPLPSLDPIKMEDPLLKVDDDSSQFSQEVLINAPETSTKSLTYMSPRSSRHVPYHISMIRDPVLKAPVGVQRVYRKPRQRVRFTCHECHALFQAHVKVCIKCSHNRCYDCRDIFSRKSKPDSRLIDAVNRRLAEVGN